MRRLRVLLASGPTREPLDPVRYLSNYSTGTMGKRLADAARRRGHKLDWVQCPETAETALDLKRALERRLPKSDVLIMAAAVCDARPAVFQRDKIKKGRLGVICLVKNPDILASLARKKKKSQVFVGFALESRAIFRNALLKFSSKKLDLLLLQRVTAGKRPFGDARPEAYLIGRGGMKLRLVGMDKAQIASILLREVEKVALEKA